MRDVHLQSATTDELAVHGHWYLQWSWDVMFKRQGHALMDRATALVDHHEHWIC
jgi:hypothetical protein